MRSPELFARGHVPGAVNAPHRGIVVRALADVPDTTLIVVYCAGPHCNGADRAALRLAELGRPVKKMIGGIEGWRNEGLSLTASSASDPARQRSTRSRVGEEARDAASSY